MGIEDECWCVRSSGILMKGIASAECSCGIVITTLEKSKALACRNGRYGVSRSGSTLSKRAKW
jgi:hypothetical protein